MFKDVDSIDKLFTMIVLTIVLICCSCSLIETYIKTQVTIEAIRAGLIQNDAGNWVKS